MGDERLPDESAAQRLAFEREAEERKCAIEERRLKHERFDSLTRLISTVAVGVLVTGGLQCYGMRTERIERERNESAQRAQIAIQLANAREKALSDLRSQMFNALLQNYFKQATDRERIAILELIGLNFRDSVQIKPMFELLDARFVSSHDLSNAAELRNELRKAARRVIEDQLNQIRQAREGAVCRVVLARGAEASPECFPKLKLRLQAVDEGRVVLRTNVLDGALVDDAAGGQTYSVRYFDMPMVDSTSVRSGSAQSWRYSVVLYDTDTTRGVADIVVALLPISAVGAQTRYAFDELLEKYLTLDR